MGEKIFENLGITENEAKEIVDGSFSQEIATPVTEKEKVLKESNKQMNKLNKEINNNSYLDFLGRSREDRIRACTKNEVMLKEIKSGKVKDLTFDFKFGGNNINEKIYLGTTAGQLLPGEVQEVIYEGITYSRENLYGELFSNTGKRLTIHQGTEILISKLRSKTEVQQITSQNTKEVEKFFANHKDYSKEKDQSKIVLLSQISIVAQRRGVDIEFAIKICMDKLGSLGNLTDELVNAKHRSSQLENILTEFSRVRGTMYKGEYLYSGKEKNKKYSDSFTIKLLERLYSGNELKIQAKKHGIDSAGVDKIINREGTRIHNRESMFFKKGIKGLLDFIATAEGTYGNYNAVFNGANQSKIKYTGMRIRDVIKLQYGYGKRKGSSAVGRYQVMRISLEDKVKEGVVNMNDIYSEKNQDKIAIAFLNQKGLQSFLGGKISRDVFQKRIAGTWRSLPKDASGKGVNEGDKMNNHATVSNVSLDRVLDNLKNS